MSPTASTLHIEQAADLFATLFQGAPFGLVFAVCGLSLLPLLLLATTSYLKLSVVLNILRSAIGGQQIPSAAVVSLLSLVLSLHIMTPVVHEIIDSLPAPASSTAPPAALDRTVSLLRAANEPLMAFLRRHSDLRERRFFADSTGTVPSTREEVSESDEALRSRESLFSLIPAFVLTELRGAFTLGFFLYLPFLVIDLLVSSILVALGMNMVSPITISFPLKLAVFVCSDAWFLLCRALVLHYR